MQTIGTKTDGVSTLSAAEFNQIPLELQNAITASGQATSSGDLYQLSKSIAGYVSVGDFYTDSGSANAYILTPTGSYKAPTAYVAGMRVRFKPANANTTASTVNVASLGVKSIKDYTGASDPAAGVIAAGQDITLVYDGTYFRTPVSTAVSAGAMVYISSSTASSSSSISLTGLSNVYRSYIVELDHVAPATDGVELWMRTSTDSVLYDSGASDYATQFVMGNGVGSFFGGSGYADPNRLYNDTHILLSSTAGSGYALGNAANKSASGRVIITNPSASKYAHINANLGYHSTYATTNTIINMNVFALRASTTPITAVRFLMSSGNIASGTFTLYGIL